MEAQSVQLQTHTHTCTISSLIYFRSVLMSSWPWPQLLSADDLAQVLMKKQGNSTEDTHIEKVLKLCRRDLYSRTRKYIKSYMQIQCIQCKVQIHVNNRQLVNIMMDEREGKDETNASKLNPNRLQGNLII